MMNVKDGGARAGSGHLASLDGVRGIAILMVLLFHMRSYLVGAFLPDQILAKAVAIGWSGVDLFFVLSGFLITGILLDTRTALNYFSSFYARRFLRVFPVYYLSLVFLFVVASHLTSITELLTPVGDHVWYWTYLANWPLTLDPKAAPAVSHFWSLAVEEQFYLVWPLVIWATPRKTLGICAIGLCAVAITLRFVLPETGIPAEWIYRNTLTRIDALALGGVGALMVRSERWLSTLCKQPLYLLLTALVGLVVVRAMGALGGSSANTGVLMQRVGYSLLALSSLCLVLFAAINSAGTNVGAALGHRLLRSRILRSFGRYSYGMYVFHVPLLIVVRHFGDAALTKFSLRYSGIPVVAGLVALCFCGAMLSFEVVEARILRLKRIFTPRQKVPVIVPELSAAAAGRG